MHRAILSLLDPIQSYGRVSLVWSFKKLTVFVASSDRDSSLLWVAKVARHPSSISALEREHKALHYLEPWAETLQIPRVLSWESDAESACLVQTAITGGASRFHLDTSAPAQVVATVWDPAFDWISRFEQIVPPPRRVALGDHLEQLLAQLQEDSAALPVARILAETRHRLPRLLSREARPAHGDFAPGNLVLTERGLGVVDWEEFGPAFPLQDLLTIVCNSEYYAGKKRRDLLETYAHVLFSQSPACRLMLSRIQPAGLDQHELGFCFYAYLGTRIRFQKSVCAADWTAFLNYLEKFGYPGPGTVIPTPKGFP